MDGTWVKALVGLVPAGMLFSGSVVFFIREKRACSWLQFIGAPGLVTVVLTHVLEAMDLFPWMGRGLKHTAGHYLDLVSAALGLTLFPAGFLIQALRSRKTSWPYSYERTGDRNN